MATRSLDKALAEALEHLQAGHLKRAESAARKILAVRPGHFGASRLLALIALRRGRPDEVAEYAKRVLAERPFDLVTLREAGLICHQAGRHVEALAAFERCLAIDAADTSARMGLAQAMMQLGDVARALEHVDDLLARHPRLAEAHYNRGLLFRELGQHDAEIDAYRRALELRPDLSAASVNLGVALRDQRRFDEALTQFDSAIAADPENENAHTIRAETLLLLGRFDAGWEAYEWRWRYGDHRRWTGREPIANKRLLVHAEQGFGDTIQFVRYVDQVAAMGAHVHLRVQDALLPLLRDYPGANRVFAASAATPGFDLYCPLLSLPNALRAGASIPATAPYLRPDAEQRAHWFTAIRTSPGQRRIGLCWAGNPKHVNDANRSMRFEQLMPLLEADAAFVSLQKDVRPGELDAVRACQQLRLFESGLRTFAETAALVSALDLVITVDTAVAHLAGALGTPVWVALPFTPDWRWQLNRSDSPWYPTARLFRQSTPRDWATVVDAIVAALAEPTASRQAI